MVIKILRIIPADALIAIVLLIGEVIFWIDAGNTPAQARFYPRFLLVCSAVLTLILLYTALRNKNKKNGNAPAVLHKQVMKVTVFMLAYIVSLYYLGYLLATLIFITGTMIYLGMRNKKVLLTVPILVSLALYLLFNNLLYVTLPPGRILGFLGM